ncbi:MAG: VCBS repeat-containing protein, partial [Verrucomicrobiota bacterium]
VLGRLKAMAPDDFSFTSTTLFPHNLEPVGKSAAGSSVRRWVGQGGEPPLEGLETWKEARRLFERRTGETFAPRFKIISQRRNKRNPGQWVTEIHVQFASASLEIQWNARWLAHWENTALKRVELRFFEEVTGSAIYADQTAAIGVGGLQVALGIPYWAAQLTNVDGMALTGHHGLAVGDVNGDGRDDLYVCDGGGLPNRLFVQQAGSDQLLEVASDSGVDWLEDSRGALLIDLDGDADQDLVVSTLDFLIFSENDGTGRFDYRGVFLQAPNAFSLAAADYDGDGDLDLYACVYSPAGPAGKQGFESGSPVPFHDAENGGRNVLVRNDGGFRFADATAEAGLDIKNRRWSFAASWEDWDRDGDPDLYVANDFGRNQLFQNQNGKFTDRAAAMGVEDQASGMSVAWGDYNRDGHPDLYIGNMFSAAGQRIAYQPEFLSQQTPQSTRTLQRMARGNSLFTGSGDPERPFRDDSLTAGVNMGLWAWSSAFADVNNDGWEDLLVGNGYLSRRAESQVDL